MQTSVGTKVGIGIVILVALIGIFAALDLYAASNLQFRANSANDFDFVDMSMDMTMSVCNPTFMPTSFNKVSADLNYKSTRIGTFTIWGAYLPPNSAQNVDSRLNIDGMNVLKIMFGGLLSGLAGKSLDENALNVNLKVEKSILGIIPFTYEKNYQISELQSFFEGRSSGWSCSGTYSEDIFAGLESESGDSSSYQPSTIPTRISFQTSAKNVYEGDNVRLNGRLTNQNGNGLSGAYILIKDEDAGSGDDDIATVFTGYDGRFSYDWYAEPRDPLDNTVEIYATFEGDSTYSAVRSSQINVAVNQQESLSSYQPSTPSYEPNYPSFYETSISLNIPYTSVYSGSILPISGRLVTTFGDDVANQPIYIKDEDTGSGDDDIAIVYTNHRGEFSYDWISEPKDPFDNVVEIYAVFEGSSEYGKTRSIQINVSVE